MAGRQPEHEHQGDLPQGIRQVRKRRNTPDPFDPMNDPLYPSSAAGVTRTVLQIASLRGDRASATRLIVGEDDERIIVTPQALRRNKTLRSRVIARLSQGDRAEIRTQIQ